MGIRGEVFSTRLLLQNRTYFFNVKENRMGDLYLNVVESKNRDSGGFDRQSVIVFADDLPSFLGEFEKSLKALEKAVRDQKRGGKDRYDGSRSGRDGDAPDHALKPYREGVRGKREDEKHRRRGKEGKERNEPPRPRTPRYP